MKKTTMITTAAVFATLARRTMVLRGVDERVILDRRRVRRVEEDADRK
jgi:hypothetical protein